MENCFLEFRGITKIFPGVVALNDVSFSIQKGTVHVIIGENGAGKSTLMKIISGAHPQTSGEIYLDGKRLELHSPEDAKKNGIAMIYQELQYVPNFRVDEFLMMGREPERIPGLIDWKALRRQAQEILDRENLHYDLSTLMRQLSVSDIQLLEITRAISQDAKVIIMDEPTSALSNAEVERLFANIEKMKARGITILYISHKMDEVFKIGDMITVMRDGCHIETKPVGEYAPESVVKAMVGREISTIYPKETIPLGEKVLEVKNLNSTMDGLFDISFYLRKGEILGLAGLMGAGRTEIVSAISGLTPYDSGEIFLNGKPLRIRSVQQAVANGIMIATEDRRRQGINAKRSIRENISMGNLNHFSRFSMIRKRMEKREVEQISQKLRIKANSIETLASTLSGGNQQKVVLAKWLLSKPTVLILDEPTRGIDVGAKREIYKLMTEMVKDGISIIMISSELPEFIGMCDRAYIVYEGRITGELDRDELTQSAIMHLATGGK